MLLWRSLIAALLLALTAPVRPPTAQGQAEGVSLRVLVSTTEQVVIELRLPPVETATLSGGTAALPQMGVLIGLPPQGDWSVRVLDVERQTVPLAHPPAEAPRPTPPPPAFGLAPPPLSTQPAALPFPLETGRTAILRDLRVLPLRFYPVRYQAERGQLEQVRRLVVQVRFKAPQRGPSPPADDWDPLLAQAVLNYDQARAWRARPVPRGLTLNRAATDDAFKVEVEADGLYRLTYADLQAAGFPLESDPRNLRLLLDGQEVAVWLPGQEDGRWDPGDWLLFYGQAARSRYTRRNVYWLRLGESPGLRMASRDVTPDGSGSSPTTYRATRRLEENHLYDSKHAGAQGDHWFWTDLSFLQTGCPTATQTYTFDLPQVQGDSATATLRTVLQGYTDGAHHLVARLNGQPLGDIQWTDQQSVTREFTFDAAWLRPVDNVLRLENGDCPPPPPPSPPPNGMAFDYFEVDYPAAYEAESGVLAFQGEEGNRQYRLGGLGEDPLLFDISDPAHPTRLTGGQESEGRFVFRDDAPAPRRYLAQEEAVLAAPLALYRDAPSHLTETDNQADYLLIGYGDFLAAAQPLLDLRAAQGLTTMAVDVQDVYDEFSAGRLDPQAIHDFLAYALAYWQGPPDYVLLVGDGTIDYLDYLGQGWRNYLPAYPAEVDPYLGETASDNRLACVAGDDILPDLHLGRLPVSSQAEMEAVAAKIVAYETASPTAPWRQRALLVADNDGLDLFAQYSDQLYHSLPAPLDGQRVYLAYPATEPYEYDFTDPEAVAAARAAVQNGMGQGRLLVTFMGHSSHSQWAEEKLLHRDDVPGLQTAGRLPVVLSLTCYTGAFHYPPYAPLDERLVVEGDGGAVAAWGGTGSGVATGHRYLAQGFFDTVLQAGGSSLGAATWAGQLRLYNNAPVNRDLIETYVLLGDPATVVQPYFGPVYRRYLPLVNRQG
ncbi:MAG TPA: hypothetical protein ENJ31_11200 [Anaerolineae bacterium]|nr:hypothetical protein [Anaerolineae bacterium]